MSTISDRGKMVSETKVCCCELGTLADFVLTVRSVYPLMCATHCSATGGSCAPSCNVAGTANQQCSALSATFTLSTEMQLKNEPGHSGRSHTVSVMPDSSHLFMVGLYERKPISDVSHSVRQSCTVELL
jgi:hypothetical protein